MATARTRSRSNIKILPLVVDHIRPDLGVCSLPAKVFSISSGSRYEEISDVVGARKNRANPVAHTKVVTNGCRLKSPGGGILVSNHQVLDIDAVLSIVPRPSPAQLGDFSLWAKQRAITAVDPSADVLAFIGEMLEALEGSIQKIKKLADLWALAISMFAREYERLLKRGVKQTSAYWLAWNFAIKPMLRDIKGLLNASKESIKRLEWLRKRNGKITFVKSRQSLEVPISGETERFYGWGVNGNEARSYKIGIRYRVIDVEWSAAASYGVRFNIPSYLLEDFGFVIVLFTKLGLYNPVKGLWELVPYSWLLDWFMSYKTLLQKELTSFTPLGDADVVSSCTSLKCKCTIAIEQAYAPEQCLSVGEDPEPIWVDLGQAKVTWYTRGPGDFAHLAGDFNFMLDWYRISILASLGHQFADRR